MPHYPIEITSRDLELLRTMLESRILTVSHAADLHFQSRIHAARKRISKLKAGGLIAERPRRTYNPSILHLTARAFTVLDQRGILDDYPILKNVNLNKRAQVSPRTLEHELAVMDVRCAFTKAVAKSPTCKIGTASTWPAMYQFQARPFPSAAVIKIKPDGYFCVQQTMSKGINQYEYYIELDRGTETQDTLAIRACCYRDFYLSGGNARRHGQHRDQFKRFPFRVLMIFPNDERRNNAAIRLLRLNPPILSQVWLSTLPQVQSDPLGLIWITPLDYRRAVAGTEFEFNDSPEDKVYRRRPQREQHVAQRVDLRKLITG